MTAPVRRQVSFKRTALLSNQLLQAFAQHSQLFGAALDHSVAPFQPKRQTQIHQLKQVQMGPRILAQPLQDQKKLLAPRSLVVKSHQQAAVRPDPCAPGRARNGFIKHRTQ